MYVFRDREKNFIKIFILLLCLVAGFLFARTYQPAAKSIKTYKQALKDYENGNYSNSYYLFSKVAYNSSLKPSAIYRQSMCAKALGDKKSEYNRYKQLFTRYPNNKLSVEAKYQAGKIIFDDEPREALKYFKAVLNSDISEDYKTAAEYYIARIESSKIRYSNKIASKRKIEVLETSYRRYLEKYPDGRLATNVASSWKRLNSNMLPEDALLLVRAYYLAGLYDEAEEVLANTKIESSWALKAANLYRQKKYQESQQIVELGVTKYADSVNRDDYNRAIDIYLEMNNGQKLATIMNLLNMAKGNNKDYIWSLKCNNISTKDKYACYNDLYKNFPKGDYAEDALYNLVLASIKSKNYAGAKFVAKDYLAKYPTSENVPAVMFWAGKVEEKYQNYSGRDSYFQNIINKYPDSYYAYRAYWLLKGVKNATFNANLSYKPVVYPYKAPRKTDILRILMDVQDYDMMLKYCNDDFIASWAQYEKGNYATSMILAKNAMDKLEVKPVKSDLRWRLVYPQNYFVQVQKCAKQNNNNEALMMAIIREESSFNSDSQSGVGAMGLMQLMPSTAHEVGKKQGITFNTNYLLNPDLNIKLGNIYYSVLKEMLSGKEVSAIAAYNGGIGSVQNWRKTLEYNDTDEFVEQIPYDETRNYVIKVFRSYWNYTRIYQK